jgi:hypothetical protein
MRCQNCGIENAAGSRFCNRCGTPLNKRVPEVRLGERSRGYILLTMRGRRNGNCCGDGQGGSAFAAPPYVGKTLPWAKTIATRTEAIPPASN